MRIDPVHQALREIARRLREENIEYAIIDGMALGYHGYVRVTQDIDLLLTREGLEKFQEILVGRGYVPAFPGARKRYRDAERGVGIDVIMSGEPLGSGAQTEIVFPDPALVYEEIDGIRVVRLETLIELKLASGLTAPHRIKDLGDVQQLIESLGLPETLAELLHPFVRDEYRRLWRVTDEARRADPENE